MPKPKWTTTVWRVKHIVFVYVSLHLAIYHYHSRCGVVPYSHPVPHQVESGNAAFPWPLLVDADWGPPVHHNLVASRLTPSVSTCHTSYLFRYIQMSQVVIQSKYVNFAILIRFGIFWNSWLLNTSKHASTAVYYFTWPMYISYCNLIFIKTHSI